MNSSRRLATGPEEARLLTELERRGIAVLNLRKHREQLSEFTDIQLYHLVSGLSAKGWLLRIEAGKYLVVPRAARGTWSEHPFVVASGIAPEPHYISFWSALSYHDLTEQLPRVVYVAVREKRKAAVAFQHWTFRFVHVADRKFFGYRHEEFTAINGAATIEVPVAEPEKAIIDGLDHQLLAGGIGEVIKALHRGFAGSQLSVEKLVAYAHRQGNAAVAARLGYLLERLGVHQAGELRPLVRQRGAAPYLSPAAPRARATLEKTWNLRANVPDEQFELETVW